MLQQPADELLAVHRNGALAARVVSAHLHEHLSPTIASKRSLPMAVRCV